MRFKNSNYDNIINLIVQHTKTINYYYKIVNETSHYGVPFYTIRRAICMVLKPG